MLRERRKYRRYQVAAELEGTVLLPLAAGGAGSAGEEEIQGRVSNISSGGLCLLTEREMEVAAPFRCDIKVPDFPVAIPTLVQVRWIDRDNRSGCRLGLQFVL